MDADGEIIGALFATDVVYGDVLQDRIFFRNIYRSGVTKVPLGGLYNAPTRNIATSNVPEPGIEPPPTQPPSPSDDRTITLTDTHHISFVDSDPVHGGTWEGSVTETIVLTKLPPP